MRYLLAAFLIYGVAGVAHAASSPDAIAYEYKRIDAHYSIQPDSSVRVEERIVMGYEGTYHSLWRGVSLGPVAVSNVEVVDADTGQILKSVEKFPDLPNDPSNFGTYAWINDDGYFKTEWYYDAADTTKTWLLRYTLRGAVEFGTSTDRFAWSLFSRYAVPVGSTTVRVSLPVPAELLGTLTAATGTVVEEGDRTLYMELGTVAPGQSVSFEVRWPKGVVHPPLRAFFITELVLRYGIWVVAVPAALVLILLAAAGVYLWRRRV